MLGENTWQKLNTTPDGNDFGLTIIRLHPESSFDIYAAKDVATGRRLLLLNSSTAECRESRKLPVGRGFEMRFRRHASGSGSGGSLQLVLTDFSFSDVFDVVGNDAIRKILLSRTDIDAFEAFIGKIAEWQAFLDKLSDHGLSENEQMGLFGELLFLNDLALKRMPVHDAISAWKGPDAVAKDFHFSGAAVEIKTTTSKSPVRIPITNEIQLDQTGTGCLMLFCVLVERTNSGAASLPDVVTSVRKQLATSPQAQMEFSQKLIQVGYLDSDASRYPTRYAVRSRVCFKVEEGFPRIIQSALPPGIGDVRYTISLTECEPFKITESALTKIVFETNHEHK